jgi:uncharacterized protein
MKKLIHTAIALLLCTAILRAETTEEAPGVILRGVLDLGTIQSFSLSTEDGVSSSWVKVGQSFKGYKVVSFDTDSQALSLEKDGVAQTISLTSAQEFANDEGTMEERLAEAKNIMALMDFEKMMNETMDAQMKAMSEMMRKQMSMGGTVDEELVAFQTKAMAEMFDEMEWGPIKDGMSKAYAEVFTKDELSSISNFYATPAGQATIQKQPALQQKTMEIMMPSIMTASQSMQKKMMDFYKQRTTEKKAAE